MKLSIVLSTQPTQFKGLAYQGQWELHAEKMAQLGYDGVELAVRDPQCLDVVRVQETLLRFGLGAPAIGTGQAYVEEGLSFTDPAKSVRLRAVERIKRHIELAWGLHALVIIGLIRGKVQEGVAKKAALESLISCLRECAQVAWPDVKLVIEPLNRYETNLINNVSETLDLIASIGGEGVGLLFDTFHANIEERSIEDAIRTARTRLKHVHVADSNRWYPGAGHLDFRSVIHTLRDTGYAGYLSAEIMPQPDPATSAERAIQGLHQFQNKE